MGNPNIARQKREFKREQTRDAVNTTSSDVLGGVTGDVVKYLSTETEKVRRVIALTITGDTGNDKQFEIRKTTTVDGSYNAATSIETLTIPAALAVKGQAVFVDFSPTSADMSAGQELIARVTSGCIPGDAFILSVVTESQFERGDNEPGGRLTQSA